MPNLTIDTDYVSDVSFKFKSALESSIYSVPIPPSTMPIYNSIAGYFIFKNTPYEVYHLKLYNLAFNLVSRKSNGK